MHWRFMRGFAPNFKTKPVMSNCQSLFSPCRRSMIYHIGAFLICLPRPDSVTAWNCNWYNWYNPSFWWAEAKQHFFSFCLVQESPWQDMDPFTDQEPMKLALHTESTVSVSLNFIISFYACQLLPRYHLSKWAWHCHAQIDHMWLFGE